MWWGWSACRCVSLAVLLVVADCGGAEQRRGAEEGLRGSTAKANSSSGRKYHRIQHGQCSYTFILPEGDGSTCREFKTGTPYNGNALQRDAPQPEADFSNQKIQQLEHVMENYTQWLQKALVALMKAREKEVCLYDGISCSSPKVLLLRKRPC